MLRKIANRQLHLAAATERASTAHRIDVDAQRACRIEQRGAGRKSSAATGRCKYDQRVVRHGDDAPGGARARPPNPRAGPRDIF